MNNPIGHTIRKLAVTLMSVTAVLACAAGVARAAEAPIKEVFSRSIGKEVDKATKQNICTLAFSQCGPAVSGSELKGSEPGGFEYPEGIVVNTDPSSPQYGDVYIGERGNNRIDVFTQAGEFVLTFGWEVNLTKSGNVCMKGETCGRGERGTIAGQFEDIQSLSMDSATGDVYIQEGTSNQRVEQYTSSGQFVWMEGDRVDRTKTKLVEELEAKGGKATPTQLEEEDLCTSASGNECQQGISSSSGHGGFEITFPYENKLSVGGPEKLLYVGDTNRIQELEADGKWKNEIPFSTQIKAVAAESTGNMFVVPERSAVVQEFDPSGKEIRQFSAIAKNPSAEDIEIDSMALDAQGHMAVTAFESGSRISDEFSGGLYDAGTGHQITGFEVATKYPVQGLTFDGEGNLYCLVSVSIDPEAFFYHHKPVADLSVSAAQCMTGTGVLSDATLDCTLKGSVGAWGVPATEAWFEWGSSSSLGKLTEPPIKVPNEVGKKEGEEETPVALTASIAGLRPNETFYFRAAGRDANLQAPEKLTSEIETGKTGIVPPRIVGEPSVNFVHPTSAVMSGEVNPENTNTEYYFQYVPAGNCNETALQEGKSLQEACTNTLHTGSLESSVYGPVGVAFEASGLQSDLTYLYRLFATNSAGEALNEAGLPGLPQGSFTTAAALPPGASTGVASAIGATSAIISGTIESHGEPALYKFEAGIDAGPSTQYGIVLSGLIGAGSGPTERSFELTGLQPGTKYAYRIGVSDGYGTELGATQTFTTGALASVLPTSPSPTLLAVPSIQFPHPPVAACKAGEVREKHGKCVKAKKARKKRKPVKGRKHSVRRVRNSHGK